MNVEATKTALWSAFAGMLDHTHIATKSKIACNLITVHLNLQQLQSSSVNHPICSTARPLMRGRIDPCSKPAFRQQPLLQQLLDHHPSLLPQVISVAPLYWKCLQKHISYNVTYTGYVLRSMIGAKSYRKFGLLFEVGAVTLLSFGSRTECMISSTGAANMKSDTAETSNTPVPTNVCFSMLITGFTCRRNWRYRSYCSHNDLNLFLKLLLWSFSGLKISMPISSQMPNYELYYWLPCMIPIADHEPIPVKVKKGHYHFSSF